MGSARLPEDLHCSVVHPGPRKRVSWVGEGGSQAPAPHARCLHRKLRLTQPVSLLTSRTGWGRRGGRCRGWGDRGMLLGSWERRDLEAGRLPRSPEGRGAAAGHASRAAAHAPAPSMGTGGPGLSGAHSRAHAARPGGFHPCPPGAGGQSPPRAHASRPLARRWLTSPPLEFKIPAAPLARHRLPRLFFVLFFKLSLR